MTTKDTPEMPINLCKTFTIGTKLLLISFKKSLKKVALNKLEVTLKVFV